MIAYRVYYRFLSYYDGNIMIVSHFRRKKEHAIELAEEINELEFNKSREIEFLSKGVIDVDKYNFDSIFIQKIEIL